MPAERGAAGLRGLTVYQWKVLLLCALTFLVEGYDVSAMSLAAPSIAKLWGVKATALGTAIVAVNIGAVIGNGFLAPFGDRGNRSGRKRTVVVSTLLLGVGVAFTATAQSVGQLVAWRFASGLAFGVATANVVALIAEQFPANRRAILVVMAATNLSIGSAIAGFAAAPITAAMTWRGLFVIGGGAGVLLALAIAAVVRADAVIEVPSAEERARVPILRLFERGLIGVTLPLWLIGFCNASILFVLLNWLPTMLTGTGWTLTEATRAPAIVSIGGVLSGLALAMLVDTGHATRALRAAFMALTATMLLFAAVPPSVATWTAMLLVAGLLCSGVHNVERGLYATLYPPAVRATGVGWGNMMSRLGNIIGTLTVAALIDLKLPVGSMLAMLAMPALVALACTVPLGRAFTRLEPEQDRR